MNNTTYWKRYFDAQTIERVEALKQDVWIESTGVRLHLDVYEQPDLFAPVLVFNHGGGGYSRLFARFALAMYDQGYTVVLPDQRGQGYSEAIVGILPSLNVYRISMMLPAGRANGTEGCWRWRAAVWAAVWCTKLLL